MSKAIVLHPGASTTKIGWAGFFSPKSIIPSVLGIPKEGNILNVSGKKKYYVGNEAQLSRGILSLKNPINKGVVNWDTYEKILNYCFFHELKVSPEDQPLLLCEEILNTEEVREKLAQVFFETFQVESFYAKCCSTLGLFSTGSTTGLVCDTGADQSRIVPITEGYTFPHAVLTTDVSGNEVENQLKLLLAKKDLKLDSSPKIYEDIKKNYCYLSEDYEKDKEMWEKSKLKKKKDTKEINDNCKSIEYLLPDGKKLILEDELFRATELLIDPSEIGVESPGIHNLIYDSIQLCNIDVKKDLYENIVLFGGTSLTKGFVKRIENEVKSLAPTTINTTITRADDPVVSSWLGGSIFASLDTFKDGVMEADDYKENDYKFRSEWEKFSF